MLTSELTDRIRLQGMEPSQYNRYIPEDYSPNAGFASSVHVVVARTGPSPQVLKDPSPPREVQGAQPVQHAVLLPRRSSRRNRPPAESAQTGHGHRADLHSPYREDPENVWGGSYLEDLKDLNDHF